MKEIVEACNAIYSHKLELDHNYSQKKHFSYFNARVHLIWRFQILQSESLVIFSDYTIRTAPDCV
jgi:hypothetical protein